MARLTTAAHHLLSSIIFIRLLGGTGKGREEKKEERKGREREVKRRRVNLRPSYPAR